MARPDWNDLSTYPKNPESWSFSRWAWEFLRRNEKFQAACDAESNSSALQRQTTAREFGLAEYKHFKEDHRFPTKCIWLSESICKYQLGFDKGDKVEFTLNRGEGALVFDLMQVKVGGLAAIDAQLYTARTTLIEFLEEIDEKPASRRVTKDGLFEILRVYDGVVHSGKLQSEVARVLYPDAFVETPTGQSDDRAEGARKKVHDQLKRAHKMVESGYLALPSRDYRTDRSKGKAQRRGI